MDGAVVGLGLALGLERNNAQANMSVHLPHVIDAPRGGVDLLLQLAGSRTFERDAMCGYQWAAIVYRNIKAVLVKAAVHLVVPLNSARGSDTNMLAHGVL